jgi:hypothetical protein
MARLGGDLRGERMAAGTVRQHVARQRSYQRGGGAFRRRRPRCGFGPSSLRTGELVRTAPLWLRCMAALPRPGGEWRGTWWQVETAL